MTADHDGPSAPSDPPRNDEPTLTGVTPPSPRGALSSQRNDDARTFAADGAREEPGTAAIEGVLYGGRL